LRLLSEPGGDFPFYSFIVGKMFSRKTMFQRAEQMEVSWSKVGAIWRMLEDLPLLLLHENARPHIANKTNEMLRNFKWEVLEHPLYSPELAPSDFHFTSLIQIITTLDEFSPTINRD
jgi:hypothetical protein